LTKKIAVALGLAACAAALSAGMTGTAGAATVRTNDRVVHSEPWHDPHCSRDGHWHIGPGDPVGQPDPRCPRW
jgi:hypothetical protein